MAIPADPRSMPTAGSPGAAFDGGWRPNRSATRCSPSPESSTRFEAGRDTATSPSRTSTARRSTNRSTRPHHAPASAGPARRRVRAAVGRCLRRPGPRSSGPRRGGAGVARTGPRSRPRRATTLRGPSRRPRPGGPLPQPVQPWGVRGHRLRPRHLHHPDITHDDPLILLPPRPLPLGQQRTGRQRGPSGQSTSA